MRIRETHYDPEQIKSDIIKTMNTNNEINISIPPAIVALPGLNLAERAVLAQIQKSPDSTNAALAKMLGVSVRGVESLLQRLRGMGLIRQVGLGRARRLHLTFPVEPHTFGEKIENENTHTICVVDSIQLRIAKPEMPISDFIDLHMSFYQNCFDVANFEAARNHLAQIRQRLKNFDQIETADKSRLLSKLSHMDNRCFAFSVGAKIAEGRTASEQRKLALNICRASSETLSMLRQQLESGAALGNGTGALALIEA